MNVKYAGVRRTESGRRRTSEPIAGKSNQAAMLVNRAGGIQPDANNAPGLDQGAEILLGIQISASKRESSR